jgi:predicted ArsR family transcriptional regulator
VLPDGTQATLREARALAHPLRLRILRRCLERSHTNAELAAALGEKPATVLHHVRTLVAAGFLAEEPSRPGPRGSTEKPYRATGRSWRMEGTLRDGPDAAVLTATLHAIAAEVDEAGPGAVIEGARLALRLTPDQLHALLEQLGSLIAGQQTPNDHLGHSPPPGDPYALFVLLHRRQDSDDR